jgi:hypothetical protein
MTRPLTCAVVIAASALLFILIATLVLLFGRNEPDEMDWTVD